MYCFIMQPWQTIRTASSITSVTQTESAWLDLTPYQDVVAWLQAEEVSAGGGTNVQMAYQTSPTKDDSLFVPVVAAFNVSTGVTTTVMLKDVATNALSRWLRWQISVTGSPSSTWDLTFRIMIAANVVGRGGRAKAAPAAAAAKKPSPVFRPPSASGSSGSSGMAGVFSASPSVPLHLQTQLTPTGSGYSLATLASPPAGTTMTKASTPGLASSFSATAGQSSPFASGVGLAKSFGPGSAQ